MIPECPNKYLGGTLAVGFVQSHCVFCFTIYHVSVYLCLLGLHYEQVLENLQHSMPEIKRLAFDALDIRVYASHDTIEIRGVIPLELALLTLQIKGMLCQEHSHNNALWAFKILIKITTGPI